LLKIPSNAAAQVSIGVVAAGSQIVSIAFVYWLVKRELGVENLGFWSLILSFASIVNFSGFGLGQSMVHFAQSVSVRLDALERYFRVAATLTLCGSLAIGAVIFWPARELIINLVSPQQAEQLNAVLPIMLISFCAAMLNRVTTFTLTGQGFFWVGQLAILAGGLAYGLVTYLLVSDLGLVGVSYGHLAMTLVTLLLGWLGVLVIRIVQVRSYGLLIPFAIYRPEFKKMISLGLSFQATSILMLFLEPLARTAIAYSGGLALVGYYEMANRFVVSPRELIARPTAYFSGRFASLSHADPEATRSLYKKMLKRFWLLGFGMLLALAIFAVPVADYWVQERHWFFFFSVMTLGVGWAFSVPALIPWNWGVGVGNNRYNLYSVAIMVLISLIFSGLAIIFQSPLWVPIGVAGGIVLGQIYLIQWVSRLLHSRKRVSSL